MGDGIMNTITLAAVRDTHAIWRSHNREHEKEFDALFELLALNPDKPMIFICEFTGCIL